MGLMTAQTQWRGGVASFLFNHFILTGPGAGPGAGPGPGPGPGAGPGAGSGPGPGAGAGPGAGSGLVIVQEEFISCAETFHRCTIVGRRNNTYTLTAQIKILHLTYLS